MAGSLLPLAKQLFQDDAWNPLVGGKVYTYEAGTLTPKTTYQNAALSIANTNPVIVNARGEVTMYGTGQYRIIAKDANDVTLWDQDNIESAQSISNNLETRLAASSGAALVGFSHGASYAPGTMGAKGKTVVCVKDAPYNAVGDGTTTDSDAIQAAHDALPSSGGTIHFPHGTYKFSGITVTKPIRITCEGGLDGGVVFTNPTASTPFFTANGVAAFIAEGFKATASVTRTSGKFFDLTNMSRVVLQEFFMEKYFVGIGVDGGSEVFINTFAMFDGVDGAVYPNSGAILLGDTAYTGSISIDNGYIKCQDLTKQCSFGIRAKYVDVMNLGAGLTIISHGTDLDIAPGNGQTASLIHSYGATLDTAEIGLRIAPTGTGRVIRSNFHGLWYGEHNVSGAVLDGSSGTIDGVTLFGGDVMNNDSIGINVFGANARNVRIKSLNVAGNPTGIRAADTANVDIQDNTIGTVGGAGVNTIGVAIAATVTGKLRENRFTSNGANISGSATGLSIFDNDGIDNWSDFTPTVTAEAGAFTAVSATGRYTRRYQTIQFEITITIATNGTAATAVIASLPVSTRAAFSGAGRAVGVSGKGLQVFAGGASSTARIADYDGAYPGADGEVLVISGTYEIN